MMISPTPTEQIDFEFDEQDNMLPDYSQEILDYFESLEGEIEDYVDRYHSNSTPADDYDRAMGVIK